MQPRLPMNLKRESSGQHTSQGRPADTTPMTRGGPQPYEFDSCISTEEAFFGLEELKNGGQRHYEPTNGSNPQEDGTPKARNYAMRDRRTVESFQRGVEASQTIKTGFSIANRQRT